jgi:hypothetical protein
MHGMPSKNAMHLAVNALASETALPAGDRERWAD